MDKATIDAISRRLATIPAPCPLGMYRGKEVYAISDVLEYWLEIAVEPDALPTEIRDEFIASLMKHAEPLQNGQGSKSAGLLICGEMPALRQIAMQMLSAASDIVSKSKRQYLGRLAQIVAAKGELRIAMRAARA